MTHAVVRTRAIVGFDAPETLVTVRVEEGQSGLSVTGVPAGAARELRDRLRSAFVWSDIPFPPNKRIQVDVVPAPNDENLATLDLPIAIGIVSALGHADPQSLENMVLIGHLLPNGTLKPIRGALMLALTARHEGSNRTLVLPAESASEAALVSGVDVRSAKTLADVVEAVRSADPGQAIPRAEPCELKTTAPPPDLRDVRGQASAKRALEVAAAGGHHLLLCGPESVAKAMLAQRLVGLLPPMAEHEALLSAAVTGLVNGFDPSRWRSRPFRLLDVAPGANPSESPSQAAHLHDTCAMAYGGVLSIEDLSAVPELLQGALMRWLASGRIDRGAVQSQASFPVKFQLVAAEDGVPSDAHEANGRVHAGTLSDQTIKVPGAPDLMRSLHDCFDVRATVLPVQHAHLTGAPDSETTTVVAARVSAARSRQGDRQGCLNATLSPKAMANHCKLDPVATKLLLDAVGQLGLSARGAESALRVARTIADLAGREGIASMHVAEALKFQRLHSS